MNDDQIIESALRILESRLQTTEGEITSSEAAQQYAILKLADRKQEVLGVFFLNTRHQVIEFREMFYGTIDGAPVFPREILRAVLETNAKAVILTHNHPSGLPEPSRADVQLTQRVSEALDYIDARVLDHIIVGGTEAVSFANRGLL